MRHDRIFRCGGTLEVRSVTEATGAEVCSAIEAAGAEAQ